MKETVKTEILKLYEKYGEIEIKCDGSNYLPIDKIMDFQGNLKKLSEKNMIRLAKSIFYHGVIAPFFVWNSEGDWKFLDGHSRGKTLNAIRESGVPIPGQFPVVEIQAESESQAREILLSITSQMGEFQKDILDDWVADMDAEIAETFRIVDTELELAIASLSGDGETTGDEETPEVPDEPITVLGDLYEFSGHRLLCGDSTKIEDVEKLLHNQKSDLIFTDPPFGMSYGGGRAKGDDVLDKKTGGVKIKAHGMIIGDDLRGEDLLQMVSNSIKNAINLTKKGSAAYICFTWRTYIEFHNALGEINLKPKACIVWDKKSIGLGNSNYRPQHEFIFYCGGQWYGDKSQSDVWYMSRGATGEYVHPTQKPVELIEKALLNSSKAEDIIHDCFGGSGSTLMACEKTGRIARIMELDPKYVDVIVSRFATWCQKNNREYTILRNGEPFTPEVKIG